MCGIAGVFNYGCRNRTADRRVVETMTRALAHRGPNGEGVTVMGPVGLGHRRLAIVDLTETGAQPMSTADGSLCIVYNGEFYNHAAFRRELAGHHRFRGTSDTETLLYLIGERGPSCLRDVMGIFGLAVWDSKRMRLLLARDHLGVKQLYYYDDGERILFASEIKALLATGVVPRELDAEALNQYLHFHTPLHERTFFRHVRQLRAGEYMEVDAAGPRLHTYWSVPVESEPLQSASAAIDELRATLEQVIQEQLLSDVPVGCFLSGGIDSSTVAAFAKRAGKPPRCFGVHFSNDSVIDERPYQEAAARQLGLELDLITVDGDAFPDDLQRLLRCQDEPVIGAAMLPMYHVAKLAASKVRVCLGGQGADELFAGYARYGLTQPTTLMRSWLATRLGAAAPQERLPSVGGNLRRQLIDRKTLARLAKAFSPSWQRRYFDHFAKVPETNWLQIIEADEVVSRANCWETFSEAVSKSKGRSPADKVMHWDVRTYLAGLFHQDDRMSMANGLESRVPLADPRLVRLAFRIPFDFKFRSGASKWVLRQAIADVLPAEVLNRRKVGFDTPAERWMRERHAGFVRDILLSKRARERGLWNVHGLERLLDAEHPQKYWFDVAWKALCIETWARELLDDTVVGGEHDAAASISSREKSAEVPSRLERLGDVLEEARELTPDERAFRLKWEVSLRTGAVRLLESRPKTLQPSDAPADFFARLPFGHGHQIRELMADRIDAAALNRLRDEAVAASRGRLVCFGRWIADFGQPIDWHLNPMTGRRWNPDAHWSKVLADERRVGDVKLSWEIGRFPHVYAMARAGAMMPETAGDMALAMVDQMRAFIAGNRYGRGIHWISGQEIVIRMLAWIFGASVLREQPVVRAVVPELQAAMYESAQHVARYITYAEKAVYNNHLIAEALGLVAAALIVPAAPEADEWCSRGLDLLDRAARDQFKTDGGYIQNSHNYHRAAVQLLLWVRMLLQHHAMSVPASITNAIERSVDFLREHQNPGDGRLPNYGNNDGALPAILSCCDYSDFRPVLQAASIATRGERLYEQGPWDEMAAWMSGPAAVTGARLVTRPRQSRSFAVSGYHVLRGRDEAGFGALRCGSVVERFSQIDMLALDVWWRGQNVIADAGSYLYNGPARWHEHFIQTGAHNVVKVDNLDQMLHHRRFKLLYWTKARLLRFQDNDGWALAEGEHYGFQRKLPGCVHRRAVLLIKDDLWIVADTVFGQGQHELQLQWLAGVAQYAFERGRCELRLDTPEGPYHVAVRDQNGMPAVGDVAAGMNVPPRGWLSRYYGEKTAVPSMRVTTKSELPATLVTVMAPASPRVERHGTRWTVEAGEQACSFTLREGSFEIMELEHDRSRRNSGGAA